LTYFGEPTGQGGCSFAPARNRKGDKLRECVNYVSPPVGRTAEVNLQQEVSMTDIRDEIFHYVRDACFSHQACPLDVWGEDYTYKGCRRWTCGHVLGVTDKIVALIEGEGHVKLSRDTAKYLNVAKGISQTSEKGG
jgi:hypothetical protein